MQSNTQEKSGLPSYDVVKQSVTTQDDGTTVLRRVGDH
jgi:hypothetical protein